MNWKRKSERLSDGLLRAAKRQVLQICEGLAQSPDEKLLNATHAVRKRIKKLRALLRLTRDRIGEPFQKKQNRTLRTIARSLAPMRDATAQLATCEKLHQHFPEVISEEVFLTVVKKLTRENGFFDTSAGSRKQLRKKLRTALKSVEKLPLRRLKKKDLRAGLKRAIRRYREEFEKARESASEQNLHAWRKRGKDLGHQLDIMGDTLLKQDGKQIARLEKLGKILGDDHDLAILEHRLRELDSGALQQLEKPIRVWRNELQKAAFKLGRNV